MRLLQRLAQLNRASVVVASLGGLFLVFYLVFISSNEAYLRGPVWLLPLGLALMLTLFVGLVYGSYWIATSGFTDDQSWRVTTWVFAGLIGAVALTFWPMFYQRIVGVSIADPIFILLVSAGLGANAGLVAGVAHIRSERQFQQIQEGRDTFEFLNRLLRHNVLNAINIINGHVELLKEELQRETALNRAHTIQQQSNQITELIQNVKVLIQQDHADTSHQAVNLSAIVAEELRTARETYAEAVIEGELAQDTSVRADRLISAVVENLLSNAIKHNDQRTPQVDVSLETSHGTAVLRVADNGPGLAQREKTDVVDPGPHGDHGIGLYLVSTLVAKYNGDVRFDDNEPRGTVVTIELPTADRGKESEVATAPASEGR